MSKTIGKYIDELFAIKKKIDAKNLEALPLKKLYDKKEAEIFDKFTKEELKSVKTKLAMATLTKRTVFNAEDWEAIYKYVYAKKAIHLLKRGLSAEALREMEADGKKVPGVSKFIKVSLSLRGVKDDAK